MVCCSECNVISDEPTPCLVLPVGAQGGEVMYFLSFLNCDDIGMCVVNEQFELFEFVLYLFMLICSMRRFLSFLMLGMCVCVVSVVVWWSLVCM